ncbi:L-asparaginase [Caballeronia arationis]|uniref:Asparaginase n=1 Tax=Caballeronia arationis TaxID=1777142 RepID=A0A7Z7I5A4_9BURK|nr:asparaginase domain-containing protein [Caballeronia arationis]SAL05729.1 L-asparaginase [Caballeronia arationis]SOE64234.1 Asparaginase [Caballeronia arationis]
MSDLRALTGKYITLCGTTLALGLAFSSSTIAQTPQPPQTSLPHVAVLATGGTIAGTGSSETQTTGYKSGVLTADVLLKSVPSLGTVAQVSGEQVSNVGSENITNDVLLKCVFRGSWTRVSLEAGQVFRAKLDSRSAATQGFLFLL